MRGFSLRAVNAGQFLLRGRNYYGYRRRKNASQGQVHRSFSASQRKIGSQNWLRNFFLQKEKLIATSEWNVDSIAMIKKDRYSSENLMSLLKEKNVDITSLPPDEFIYLVGLVAEKEIYNVAIIENENSLAINRQKRYHESIQKSLFALIHSEISRRCHAEGFTLSQIKLISFFLNDTSKFVDKKIVDDLFLNVNRILENSCEGPLRLSTEDISDMGIILYNMAEFLVGPQEFAPVLSVNIGFLSVSDLSGLPSFCLEEIFWFMSKQCPKSDVGIKNLASAIGSCPPGFFTTFEISRILVSTARLELHDLKIARLVLNEFIARSSSFSCKSVGSLMWACSSLRRFKAISQNDIFFKEVERFLLDPRHYKFMTPKDIALISSGLRTFYEKFRTETIKTIIDYTKKNVSSFEPRDLKSVFLLMTKAGIIDDELFSLRDNL